MLIKCYVMLCYDSRREKGVGLGYSLISPFWSEKGVDFPHFGLESGMIFEGTTGNYERIYRFNSE